MKRAAGRSLGPLFEVRHSRVHGHGVFALRRIRKGTTVIEYLGDRITHAQADARYEDKDPRDNHTFLFTVDSKTVIDAGVNGNEARFINHGCDPNCQSTTAKKRIFIESIRTIQPGEELAYDYEIQRDDDDPADVDEIFACRCGAENCRGSMLEAVKKPRSKKRLETRKAAGKKAAGKKAAGKKRHAVGEKKQAAAGKKSAAGKARRSRAHGR